MRSDHRQQQRGVTMVEILVVVAIAAILATLAAPSFTTFMNNSRQSSVQSQLLADLNRARNEAIKRNARVLVCNGNATNTNCSDVDVTNWNGGWLLCYDKDADDGCDPPGGADDPNPFVVRPAIHNVLTLTLTSGAAPLRFNATGAAGGGATLTIAPAGSGWDGAQTRTLTVSASGNIAR